LSTRSARLLMKAGGPIGRAPGGRALRLDASTTTARAPTSAGGPGAQRRRTRYPPTPARDPQLPRSPRPGGLAGLARGLWPAGGGPLAWPRQRRWLHAVPACLFCSRIHLYDEKNIKIGRAAGARPGLQTTWPGASGAGHTRGTGPGLLRRAPGTPGVPGRDPCVGRRAHQGYRAGTPRRAEPARRRRTGPQRRPRLRDAAGPRIPTPATIARRRRGGTGAGASLIRRSFGLLGQGGGLRREPATAEEVTENGKGEVVALNSGCHRSRSILLADLLRISACRRPRHRSETTRTRLEHQANPALDPDERSAAVTGQQPARRIRRPARQCRRGQCSNRLIG
jgi:hypothetical protein